MNIKIYTNEYRCIWDNFVRTAKNSHFFFNREYMEYHSDRFKDFSLLFFDTQNKLLALLPANINNGILYSHQGLTFGGFIVDNKMGTELMLNIFDELKIFCTNNGIKKIIYKCIPYIYHRIPAEEDRYALFINDAQLFRRDVTTTIYLDNKIKYQERRARSIKKALNNNISIEHSNDYECFWKILESTLEKQHNTRPVHSLNEIITLHNLFPKNINLFLAKKENKYLAGIVTFVNENIAHTQYIANSTEGRDLCALDILIDHLIVNIYKDKKYFDFGISNENSGRYLNTGLIAQKEGFGARAIAHDFYELTV